MIEKQNDTKCAPVGRRVMQMKIERIKDKLSCIELTKPMIEAYEEQLFEILAFHAAKFNSKISIDEQMKKLAFDAYTQGILDGQKLMVKT